MKDKCVSCDKETKYEKSVHIDLRKYYVEGAGQLCKVCWGKVFGRALDDHPLTKWDEGQMYNINEN